MLGKVAAAGAIIWFVNLHNILFLLKDTPIICKLNKWKTFFPILINSILSHIPLFFLSSFRIPNGCIRDHLFATKLSMGKERGRKEDGIGEVKLILFE